MRRVPGAAIIILLCACDASGGEAGPASEQLTRLDTLVTAASGALGEVSGMAVAPDGRLWLTDRINNHLAVVDPESGLFVATGREGEGPGEFRGAEGVAASGEHVVVFETRNRRLQEFTPDAALVRSVAIDVAPFRPLALNERGDVVVPTLGRDSSLALVVRHSGPRYYIGTAVAPPPQMIQIAHVREQALRGEVPVEFSNNVVPVLDPTGRAFLVMQATGAVMAFGPDGEQQWSTFLPAPDVASSRAAFFERYRADTTGTSIHVPEMVRSGASANRMLWLSLPHAANGSSAVVVLDENSGELIRRFELPVTGPVGSIAVDAERHRLFVTIPDEALLLMAPYAPR